MLAPLAALAALAWAAADPFDGDPFKRFQWPDLKKEFLGAGARTRFDDRVKVLGPAVAEDSMSLPITVLVLNR